MVGTYTDDIAQKWINYFKNRLTYNKEQFNLLKNSFSKLKIHVDNQSTLSDSAFNDVENEASLLLSRVKQGIDFINSVVKDFSNKSGVPAGRKRIILQVRSNFVKLYNEVSDILRTSDNSEEKGSLQKLREKYYADQTERSALAAKARSEPIDVSAVSISKNKGKKKKVGRATTTPGQKPKVAVMAKKRAPFAPELEQVAQLEAEESRLFENEVKPAFNEMVEAIRGFYNNSLLPAARLISVSAKKYEDLDTRGENTVVTLSYQLVSLQKAFKEIKDLLDQVKSIHQSLKVSPEGVAQKVYDKLNLQDFAAGLARDVKNIHTYLGRATEKYERLINTKNEELTTISDRFRELDKIISVLTTLNKRAEDMKQKISFTYVLESIKKQKDVLQNTKTAIELFIKKQTETHDYLKAQVEQYEENAS